MASFWQVHARSARTRTRDTSAIGLHFISGLLRQQSGRTIAGIGRQAVVSEQNMQHFISQSPWSGREMIERMQEQIRDSGMFDAGSMLLLDESGDEKASDQSVGAGRQYNGRQGKVDVSQMGVYLTLTKPGLWMWIDGELYIPVKWFEAKAHSKRDKTGIPPERIFQTKPELGWQMIQRLKAAGIPFEAVSADSLYGRNPLLRDQCTEAAIECYTDVPGTTVVYLTPPETGAKSVRVDAVGELPDTLWHHLVLRPGERGRVEADFAARRVWSVRADGRVVEEWLLIRDDSRQTYTLSNAPANTLLFTLATRARCFAERGNQDAKSELGWDEFQATKFRAWEHHLALTLLASWFVTETKHD